MAIVNSFSDLIRDPIYNPIDPPSPSRARGRLIAAIGTVTNAADDSNLSTYMLTSIPSDAILHEDTFFDVQNWGFAQVVIGLRDDPTALVNQTKATEAVVHPIAQGDGFHGKAAWEVFGLAQNPREQIGIFAHAVANATALGEMKFRIVYFDD